MKSLRIVIIIVAVIVLIPAFGHLYWLIKKGEEKEIVVINKTMLKYRGSENKAFNWILNNMKIMHTGSRPYDLRYDYYGSHFERNSFRIEYPKLKDIPRVVEKASVFYYADNQGYTAEELMDARIENVSEYGYGGLNNTDYLLCREIFNQRKPLVIEYNFFAPPTEPLVRYNMEQLLDVYWLGWRGVYLRDLDREQIKKVYGSYIEWYEAPGRNWDFAGSGIMMVNDNDRRVVVLRDGEDINVKEGFLYSSDEARKRFHVSGEVTYDGWFTLIYPGKNKVLCTFNLNATEKGKALLLASGLPDTFPAVIEGNDDFFFLTGDFGKNTINLHFSKVMIINNLISLYKRSGTGNPDNFFFTFYRPLMTGILKEINAPSVDSEEE